MKLNIDDYVMESKNVKVKGKFINRELSWLDFNDRVLSCALKSTNPMNERFNFLGITESNLDEFLSVRFSSVFHDMEKEPYKDILRKIKKFKENQNITYMRLMKDAQKSFGTTVIKPDKLDKKEREKLYEVFESSIFPRITPIDISINDINLTSGLSYVVAIIRKGNRESISVIPLLKEMDPIYQIGKKIIFLEDIILYFMKDNIFINQEILYNGVFRIIKDASVILSHDENRFIIDRMQESLNLRDHGKPIFLELQKGCSEYIETRLAAIFKIPSGHVYNKNHLVNYKIFMRNKLFNEKESYTPFTAYQYENYKNYYSIFDALKEEDILLHHPYDSYETVVKFLEHAAIDPDVETIKQTLYRVSGLDSPIVNALCKAASNGKFVTVLVEIKARFDEDNNIQIINKLKSYGVNVILGDEFLKTHCKICIITRRESDRLKVYSHVATGNYNEKTARIYTDLSYFTSKQKIGVDILNIFNILSGNSKPDDKLQKIYYAPVNLRKRLESCIDREIEFAKKDKKAEIFIKVNSISDPGIVNKLYEAADKGVKIFIICRGVCSVVARKNIIIKSIVGRFLEHSRIYYFKNGKSPEYYISSADLLTRNLDRRVETLISLKDSNVVTQISWIIDVMMRDKINSFMQTKDGIWIHEKGNFDSHQWFIEHSYDIIKKKL